MFAADQQTEPARPKTTAERCRELSGKGEDSAALELALAEKERLDHELTKQQDVEIDSEGRLVAKSLEGLWRIGNMLANSGLVPERFQGKPNDCAIGHQMAQRLGTDTVPLLQGLYVVYGTPGLEGKVYSALLNGSPEIDGRIRYETKEENGEVVACRAVAKDRQGVEHHGAWITWEMVKAEGWDKDKKNKQTGYVTKSKWNTMPGQMFRYRAAAFLGRSDFPDVIMGLHTKEELEDISGRNLDGQTPDSGDGGFIRPVPKNSASPQEIAAGDPVEPPTPIEDRTEAPVVPPKVETPNEGGSEAANSQEQPTAGQPSFSDEEPAPSGNGEANAERLQKYLGLLERCRTDKGCTNLLQKALAQDDPAWTDAEKATLQEKYENRMRDFGKAQD